MYGKLKLIIDVIELINAKYISEMNSKDLVVGDIKATIVSLDPFSQYMEKST
jgi:hypothetical protein